MPFLYESMQWSSALVRQVSNNLRKYHFQIQILATVSGDFITKVGEEGCQTSEVIIGSVYGLVLLDNKP